MLSVYKKWKDSLSLLCKEELKITLLSAIGSNIRLFSLLFTKEHFIFWVLFAIALSRSSCSFCFEPALPIFSIIGILIFTYAALLHRASHQKKDSYYIREYFSLTTLFFVVCVYYLAAMFLSTLPSHEFDNWYFSLYRLIPASSLCGKMVSSCVAFLGSFLLFDFFYIFFIYFLISLFFFFDTARDITDVPQSLKKGVVLGVLFFPIWKSCSFVAAFLFYFLKKAHLLATHGFSSKLLSIAFSFLSALGYLSILMACVGVIAAFYTKIHYRWPELFLYE